MRRLRQAHRLAPTVETHHECHLKISGNSADADFAQHDERYTHQGTLQVVLLIGSPLNLVATNQSYSLDVVSVTVNNTEELFLRSGVCLVKRMAREQRITPRVHKSGGFNSRASREGFNKDRKRALLPRSSYDSLRLPRLSQVVIYRARF